MCLPLSVDLPSKNACRIYNIFNVSLFGKSEFEQHGYDLIFSGRYRVLLWRLCQPIGK